VPNYSFENYTSCPTASGQLIVSPPWNALPNNDVEYYNTCAIPCSGPSIPCQNSLSYQIARNGDAMSGFWMLNVFGGDYREYLQVALIDTLMNSTCYYVRYYVNLHNGVNFAVNNFGVYFSNYSFMTTGNPAPFIPQINSTLIVSDTLNWRIIQGIYSANGNEKFLTIGNFFDDLNTDTLQTGNGTYPGAYYFIDDVSVIPIDSIVGGMPAFAGNDTLIMEGDSIFIGQEISNLNCNWYDANSNLIATNISGIYVQPDSTATYYVEQNLCSTVTYDTVTVFVSPLGIDENNWSNNFKVYPNPNNGNFIVSVNANSNIDEISVVDLNGRIVYSKRFQNINSVIEIETNLEQGIYIINLKDNFKMIWKRKLIVVH
jgi:hypothetical protein